MSSRIARALPLVALLLLGVGCRHATEEPASSTSAPPGEVWLSREQVQGARHWSESSAARTPADPDAHDVTAPGAR